MGIAQSVRVTIQPVTLTSGMQRKPAVQCVSLSLAPCLAIARLRGLTAGSDPSRYYLYTPELQLMAETEQSTSTAKQIAYTYLWFGGQPVAEIENATSSTRWYANNHLGTPYLQTDSTGAVAWRAEYTPYGDAFSYRSGVTLHQPLRLPGQNTTDGNSLYNNVFRWYRSGWGRYTQADPIGLVGDQTYAYATNNPLSFYDPLGESTVDVADPGERTYTSVDATRSQGGCPANSESCTIYDPTGIWLDCPCDCKGGSGYGMTATGHVTKLTMHLAPPFAKYRAHEQIHMRQLRSELENYLDGLEELRYAEKEQCETACKAEQGQFTKWVRAFAKRSNEKYH
jgi:RHS repeat-associated protein